jgi:outer membrane receptor protein involved in Fe transport
MHSYQLCGSRRPMRRRRALRRACAIGLCLMGVKAFGQTSQPAEPQLAVPDTIPALKSPAPTTQPATTLSTPTTMPAPELAAPNSVTAEPLAGSTPPSDVHDVVVTADLDRSREQIAPSLGAVSYTIGPNQISNIPLGDNAPFQQVLLRAPGVVEDSFGQEHVRGEHANLTYRVNGVLLPEGISSVGGFGQELDTHLASSVTLITGSLPAQFGFHTAGIVDVTTKSGATLDHNEVSIYGGSYDTFQPSFVVGGHSGKLDYFVSGSAKYNGVGIENPTSSVWPDHDYTSQFKLFTYLSYHIDDTSRVSVMLNGSYADFQLPDTPGLTPAFSLINHPNANSASDNENQNEQDYYSVISYQKTLDTLSFQASAFTRYGRLHFTPDPVNDLIFQGVASEITNDFLTDGVQFDASYKLNDQNTVRFGLLGDYTGESLDATATVFPVDASGAQSSNVPFAIRDTDGNWGSDVGIYLQDEWKITDQLTLNYGGRYDRFYSSFDNESQVSPRINLVWQATKSTTLHAGYSRYFQPPPIQYVDPAQIARFAGTTNAPGVFRDDPTRVERSDYYDVGIAQQINPAWQVTLDGFYKGAKPLLDSGQFGNAIILAPFNYEVGSVEGAELSSTYKHGGWSLFGNFSWVHATGRDIISNQYLIGSDELAFIKTHNIRLDHEGEFTGSAGIAYAWKNNRVYVDLLYGSGLRAGFANTLKEPQYAPVSVGYEHIFHPDIKGVQDVHFRIDIANLFDEVYQLRNGTGIGVAAAQFGARRTLLTGLTFDF